jgi:hypothetical protein
MLKAFDEDMDVTNERMKKVLRKVDAALERTGSSRSLASQSSPSLTLNPPICLCAGRPHWQIILCLSLLIVFLLFIIVYT